MSHSCKHPLKAFKIGVNSETGKDRLKITSYETDHIERIGDNLVPVVGDFVSDQANFVYYNWTEIPCGQCIACRLQYSREWANRCCLEMKDHKESYFITLTYDDDHLPTQYITHPETGEVDFPVHSLQKEDFQKFMKRLRYYAGNDELRFFGCGEYGEKNARPHMHIIVFGLHLDDLKLYRREYCDGFVTEMYNSELLDKAWQHRGFVVVEEANWYNIAYTARYVTKKLKGPAAEFYDKYSLQPEFCLMSRKPGIGRNYFDTHSSDLFDSSDIVLGTPRGSISCSIPKYYKNLLDKLDGERYNKVKKFNKEQALISKKIKLQKTSLSYLDYLETEEENLKASVQSLKRNKV